MKEKELKLRPEGVGRKGEGKPKMIFQQDFSLLMSKYTVIGITNDHLREREKIQFIH